MPLSATFALSTPELLHIEKDGQTSLGANQEWYSQLWQRQAGCGPTNCAHLLWYLAQTRPVCRPLAPVNCAKAPDFLRFMEQIWHYVTPGRMGVNSSAIFTRGALCYAEERGVKLNSRVLEIPARLFVRPNTAALVEYFAATLGRDLPVAFLNLGKGALPNLDNWHWVTLIACDTERLRATMYDQGHSAEIDLGLWLRTTALGGALVAMEEQPAP